MNINDISNDVLKNLALGNSFKNEYDFYKYMQDGFDLTTTEKENILLLIMAYRFMLFDIGYILDLNPDNKEILQYFNRLKKEFNELETYFDEKYGMLSLTSLISSDQYCYLNKPWMGDL